MTLVSEIITSAFRVNNLVGVGETPTAIEQAEALTRLNSIFKSVLGFEVGEQLVDIPLDLSKAYQNSRFMDYPPICDVTHPPTNTRLIAGSDSAQTVFLVPQPDDGARMAILDPLSVLPSAPVTLNGNGRLIEGQPTLTLTSITEERVWMYRADKADWTLLSPINNLLAEMPFPEDFDDYFIQKLSVRLAPSYGVNTRPESASWFSEMEKKIRARYRQHQQVPSELSLWISPWYEFGYFPTGRI